MATITPLSVRIAAGGKTLVELPVVQCDPPPRIIDRSVSVFIDPNDPQYSPALEQSAPTYCPRSYLILDENADQHVDCIDAEGMPRIVATAEEQGRLASAGAGAVRPTLITDEERVAANETLRVVQQDVLHALIVIRQAP